MSRVLCRIAANDFKARPKATDIFTSGHDGTLVAPEDVAGLTAALEAMVADPARRRAYGQAALQTAAGYDQREIGARWEQLLGALALEQREPR